MRAGNSRCGDQMPLLRKLACAPPPGLEAVPSQIVIRQSTTSGMAIASMVMGLLWMYWIGSILAICLGYAAKREIRNNPGRIEGQGMATAGIVLGWIGIGMLAATIAFWVFILEDAHRPPGYSSDENDCVDDRRTGSGYRGMGMRMMSIGFSGVSSARCCVWDCR